MTEMRRCQEILFSVEPGQVRNLTVFKTVQMNRAVNFDTAQGLVGLYDTSHL